MHYYEVIWSIPTRRRPIPNATASVFFRLEVEQVRIVQRQGIQPHSSLSSQDECIRVTYTLESQALRHDAAVTVFREAWLDRILTAKRNLMLVAVDDGIMSSAQ